MSDGLLDAIDQTLNDHEQAAADVTGNPWPGRVPDLDEVIEVLFGTPLPRHDPRSALFVGGPVDGRIFDLGRNPLLSVMRVAIPTASFGRFWTDSDATVEMEPVEYRTALYVLVSIAEPVTYRYIGDQDELSTSE